MSTTERDKCGLSSFFPMSCRNRAETFARHLHCRLKSLGNQDGSSSADESSWLAAHEGPIAVSHQPRHASDSDLYFNFNLPESPSSPEDEISEPEFMKLINNKDNLKLKNGMCTKLPNYCHSNTTVTNSHDSDSSDGPYYDTESDEKPINTHINGFPEDDTRQLSKVVENHVHESPPSENHLTELNYESSSVSSNFTEEESTLSLRDEDYLSIECSSAIQDLPQDSSIQINEEEVSDQEIYSSSLNVEKDLTVECPVINVELKGGEELSQETEIFLKVEPTNDDLDNDIEREEPIPRVRRCSSLKTGKTPPGTPGRKKIVRFADVLGLDLADVRTFLDEIPKIPISAYEDLIDADISVSTSDTSLNSSFQKFHPSAGNKPEKLLLPLFQQPGGQPNFLDKVREKNVCLENAVVTDPIDLSIKGIVRVRNLDFHKSVHIRYSLDSWKTYADLQATYVENSCDGFSDTFNFLLYANTLTIGQKLEFAVRYHCKGYQYWDNNYGANYCFQCLPSSNNLAFSSNGHYDDPWGASFY